MEKEVFVMIKKQWQLFMKKVEYKKYQNKADSNRPYVNDLQKKLMEKYQLEYFRQYPFEDEFNRRSGVNFKR